MDGNSIHKAKPCPTCARTIIQAGIYNAYLRVGEGAVDYVVVPARELEWVQSVDEIRVHDCGDGKIIM